MYSVSETLFLQAATNFSIVVNKNKNYAECSYTRKGHWRNIAMCLPIHQPN